MIADYSKNINSEKVMIKSIEFSKEQYMTLVKLCFYGEWVLNANTSNSELMDKDATDLMEYIFKKNSAYDLQEWFDIFPYGDIELKEEVIMELLEDVFIYNEETFIIYLIDKLAAKKAIEEIKNLGVDDPDDALFEELEFEHKEKYEKIIAKSGIAGLELNEI